MTIPQELDPVLPSFTPLSLGRLVNVGFLVPNIPVNVGFLIPNIPMEKCAKLDCDDVGSIQHLSYP